jgi:hypothetical protein
MFSKLLRKKRVFVGATVATLALAGGAFAYFTSSGTGTGYATVGTPATWEVTVAAPTGGPLYPGAGIETVGYTVTNNSGGNQLLSTTTVALTQGGGGEVLNVSSGKYVPGCKASWFILSPSSPNLPDNLASKAAYTEGSVTIELKNEPESQNACQGVAPQVTVSAS